MGVDRRGGGGGVIVKLCEAALVIVSGSQTSCSISHVSMNSRFSIRAMNLPGRRLVGPAERCKPHRTIPVGPTTAAVVLFKFGGLNTREGACI